MNIHITRTTYEESETSNFKYESNEQAYLLVICDPKQITGKRIFIIKKKITTTTSFITQIP